MPSTFDVHEGRPSWHQQKAGHISAGVTSGFKTREEAEVYMERCREYRPNEPRFIVERATIVFEGREFVAGGFSVDLESGRMVAYVTRNEYGQYWLTTWNGERLARLHKSGESRTGFHGTMLESFKTVEPIAGYHWYGRGLGAGMMLRLRRGRKG